MDKTENEQLAEAKTILADVELDKETHKEITTLPSEIKSYTSCIQDIMAEKRQEAEQQIPEEPEEEIQTCDEAEDRKQDFEDAKGTLKDVVDIGKEALDELFTLAKAAEHPFVYEVMAKMMKTITDSSEKVLKMHKEMMEMNIVQKELDKEQTPRLPVPKSNGTGEKPAVHIENALFAGTTAELLENLEAMKKANAETPVESEECSD
jgi:multidrug efflux pump subunit AcrB